MYVTAIPNRNSPPAILLRESYRDNGKVKTRTIANISHLRPQQIQALRAALSGSVSPAALPLPDSFLIEHSRPHGMSRRFSALCANFSSMPFLIPSPAASAISLSP